MKEFIINILKGMVIGLANIIPGVSGGTMMVSMGIYDRLILLLTHFVKKFNEASDSYRNRYVTGNCPVIQGHYQDV